MSRVEREALEAALAAWRVVVIKNLYRRGQQPHLAACALFVRHTTELRADDTLVGFPVPR